MQDGAKTSLYFAAAVAVIGSVAFGNFTRVQQDIGSPKVGALPTVQPQDIVASGGADISLAPNKSGITESEYFYLLTQLLEVQFVDPIKVKSKLAQGAVRGMITSLQDPDSYFMTEEEVTAFEQRQKGLYHGIGAELTLKFDAEKLSELQAEHQNIDPMLLFPSLYIQSVLPGSPAEKAGFKSGDRVMAIGSQWVFSYEDLNELKALQDKVDAGKASPAAVIKLKEDFQKRVENNLTANKAMQKLTLGQGTQYSLAIRRNGEIIKQNLTTAEVQVPILQQADNALHLRLFRGASKELSSALKTIRTIDLRNSGDGDQGEVEKVMAVLGGQGNYGFVQGQSAQPTIEFSNSKAGLVDPDSLTLKVDASTTGAAKMIALALAAQGAKLDGKLRDTKPAWQKVYKLEDKTGYVLAIGSFEASTVKPVGVAKR